MPAQSGCTYSRRRLADGLLEEIHTHPREHLRLQTWRRHQPAKSALDSQSAKNRQTIGTGGCEAGKKIKGRKRGIEMDMLGLLRLMALRADFQDRAAARLLLTQVLGTHD